MRAYESDRPLSQLFTTRGSNKAKRVQKVTKLRGNTKAKPGHNPLLPVKMKK